MLIISFKLLFFIFVIWLWVILCRSICDTALWQNHDIFVEFVIMWYKQPLVNLKVVSGQWKQSLIFHVII